MLKLYFTFLLITFNSGFILNEPNGIGINEDLLGDVESTAHYIVGGRNASFSEFPYIVALKYGTNSRFRCGGSVIHQSWILTAGKL